MNCKNPSKIGSFELKETNDGIKRIKNFKKLNDFLKKQNFPLDYS